MFVLMNSELQEKVCFNHTCPRFGHWSYLFPSNDCYFAIGKVSNLHPYGETQGLFAFLLLFLQQFKQYKLYFNGMQKMCLYFVINYCRLIENVLIENGEGYIYLGQRYSLREKNQDKDTTKNHGRLGGIRQTLGYLQKQPCHLPEETGVQLLCAASYDIWCRDLDTDQTSTEQTCGRTYQMEISVLNITYKDRKTNIWVRERTK